MECLNDRAIKGRIRSIRRHAIHILREPQGRAIFVYVPEIGIEGPILLRHEDDMIDCAYISCRTVIRTGCARHGCRASHTSAAISSSVIAPTPVVPSGAGQSQASGQVTASQNNHGTMPESCETSP